MSSRLLSVPAVVLAVLAFASTASAAPFSIGQGEQPTIVANPAGDAFVSWAEIDNSDAKHDVINVCRVPVGQATCDRKKVFDLGDATYNSVVSAIVRDPSGPLYVVYNLLGSIYVASSSDDGQTWTTPKLTAKFGNDSGGLFGFDNAAFGPGQFGLTIARGYGSSSLQRVPLTPPATPETKYAKNLVTDDLATEAQVAPISGLATLTIKRSIARDGALKWRAFTGQGSADSNDVSAWTPQKERSGILESAALSGNGIDAPVVAGFEGPTAREAVVLRRYDAAKNDFGDPITVNPSGGGAVTPRVVQDTGGGVGVVWQSDDVAGVGRSLLYTASSSDVFPLPKTILTTDSAVDGPRLAAGDDGRGALTYQTSIPNDGSKETVWIANLGGVNDAFPKPPPTTTTGTQTTPPVTPPAPPSCAKQPVLGIATLRAISGCFAGSGTSLTIATPFLANGVTIDPKGQTVKIDTAKRTIELPSSTVMSMNPIVIGKGARTLTFPTDGEYKLGDVDLGAVGYGAKLLGLDVTGTSTPSFVKNESHLTTYLRLPFPFGKSSAKVTLTANNFVGLKLSGVVADVPALAYGFQDLHMEYVADPPTWKGSLSWYPPGSKADYHGSFAIVNSGLESLEVIGRFGLPGLELAPPYVFMPAAGLKLDLKDGIRFIGKVIVGAGPSGNVVSAGNLGETPGADDYGTVDVRLSPGPFEVSVKSNVYAFGQKLGNGFVTYTAPAKIAFGANAEIFDCTVDGKGALGISGNFHGGLSANDGVSFNLAASSTICTPIGNATGKAVLSSKGVAGCASISTPLGDVAGGLGHYWDDKIYDWDVFEGCDIASYEAKLSRAADATGFDVGSGLKQLNVEVRGAPGAPPQVALVAPDGTRAEPVAPGKGGKGNNYVAISSVGSGKTTYLIAKPASGRWSVVPAAGSAPVTAVGLFRDAPDPVVRAKATRVASKFALAYEHPNPVAGDAITFVAEGGGTTQKLGVATGAKGTLRFAPQRSAGGKRTVYAVIERDGFAIDKRAVATFVAPAAPKAGVARKLRATRKAKSTTVTLRWTPGRAVTSQELTVERSDGVANVYRYGAKTGRLVLRGVPANVTLKATLTGTDALLRTAKPAKVAVKVAKAKKKRK